MNYQLPKRLQSLVPYEPIQGDYAIRLDANESYFGLSETGIEKIKQSLSEIPYNRYPDPYAKAVCQAFASRYGINPEAIVAGDGSDELIGLLAGTFFDTNDTVAVFDNDFSMYRLYMELYGTKCVTLPKEQDLTIDVDKTIAAIKAQNICAIVFSNPCNPTSLGLTRDKVLKLIESVDALVILDEAYMDFWDQSLLDVVEDYQNLLILRTCSKAIGLAGIRLGFAIGNQTLIRAMKAAKAPYNVNRMAQSFAEILLQETDYLTACENSLIEGTKSLYEAIVRLQSTYADIDVVYQPCTNFVYLKTAFAKEWYEALLNQSIAIRYMGDYLRITCGSPEENKQFLQVFAAILNGGK